MDLVTNLIAAAVIIGGYLGIPPLFAWLEDKTHEKKKDGKVQVQQA